MSEVPEASAAFLDTSIQIAGDSPFSGGGASGIITNTDVQEARCEYYDMLNDEISYYESLANDDDEADWPHRDGRYRDWLQQRLAEVASLRGVIAARDLAIERLQQDVERWMDQASKWLVYRDALDAASERYCTLCEIERLCDQLSECRRLLREAVAHLGDVRTNDDGVKQWVEAARAAGGGDE